MQHRARGLASLRASPRALVSSGALISILFLLAGPVAHAQTAVDPKYLLVPGKSMGPVRLGMSIDEVKALLGPPSSVNRRPQYDWYFFGNESASKMNGVAVFLSGGKVVTARTFETAYRTAEGLGVGSTLTELIAAYGAPQRQTAHTYNFNSVVHINELYVEWGVIGVSAHIDRSTQRVAFFDIDTPQ